MKNLPRVILSLFVGVLLLSGCNNEPAATENPEPEKMSLADTVSKAESLIGKINDAADNIEAAHGPLHEIGHVLEGIPKLVDESDMSSEDADAVKAAVETLMDNFGKVDAKLHGKEGADYADVKDQVDEALKTLLSKFKS